MKGLNRKERKGRSGKNSGVVGAQTKKENERSARMPQEIVEEKKISRMVVVFVCARPLVRNLVQGLKSPSGGNSGVHKEFPRVPPPGQGIGKGSSDRPCQKGTKRMIESKRGVRRAEKKIESRSLTREPIIDFYRIERKSRERRYGGS